MIDRASSSLSSRPLACSLVPSIIFIDRLRSLIDHSISTQKRLLACSVVDAVHHRSRRRRRPPPGCFAVADDTITCRMHGLLDRAEVMQAVRPPRGRCETRRSRHDNPGRDVAMSIVHQPVVRASVECGPASCCCRRRRRAKPIDRRPAGLIVRFQVCTCTCGGHCDCMRLCCRQESLYGPGDPSFNFRAINPPRSCSLASLQSETSACLSLSL